MLPPHDLQQLIGQRRHQRADELGEGFCRFRELIGKLGSGERTSTGLTQAEASEAIKSILAGQASPAQAGAFLIAHRLHAPGLRKWLGCSRPITRWGPRCPQSSAAW